MPSDQYDVKVYGFDGALKARSFRQAEDIARMLLVDGYDVEIGGCTYEIIDQETQEIATRSTRTWSDR
jgi:hypothetical protein